MSGFHYTEFSKTGSILLNAEEKDELFGYVESLKAENAKLRELVLDYEELTAKLCDSRECDGCPFDSERTICEHMRLIARVGELGVEV